MTCVPPLPDLLSDLVGRLVAGPAPECVDLRLPEHGVGAVAALDRLVALAGRTPDTAGATFFSQLFGGRDDIAVLGDIAASLLNTSMYTRKVAGIQAAVEAELVGTLCRLVGYREGTGTVTPGGSLSNLVALLLARNAAVPTARQRGLDGSRLTVYASEDAHYSVRKAVGILGLGRRNLRTIATDRDGRMIPGRLAAALDRDLGAGILPVAVVATAGTTVRGAFDPLAEVAHLARRRQVWCHVDGAFGAPLILSNRLRDRLAGIHLADSVTWDAHKLMGVPLTLSLLLVRRGAALRDSLAEEADYLFQAEDDGDEPGMTSLQCGRRNDALKLWVAWQAHGRAGYAARFDHLADLADHAAARVRAAPDLDLAAEPQSLTVCFRVRDVDSRALCAALEREGQALISHGRVDGLPAVRLVLVNPDLTEADIDRLFERIRWTAAGLAGTTRCSAHG